MARPATRGFTLIELMIVVAILGVLAATAIPLFTSFMNRSRTTEATLQLKQLFTRASTYYARSRAESGLSGAILAACAVNSADNAVAPNAEKQAGNYQASGFAALDFQAPPTYYRLELENPGGARCSIPHSTADIYVFRARGDLDADGTQSLFELAAGSDAQNELYHSRSFYTQAETE